MSGLVMTAYSKTDDLNITDPLCVDTVTSCFKMITIAYAMVFKT